MDRLTLSDERLMTLAVGGDEQAFAALVRRMGSAILTVTSRMLGNDAAAEEAFVDVVSKLWLGRSTYRGGRPVRPWLMAIAANTCRERLRESRTSAAYKVFDEHTARPFESTSREPAALSERECSERLEEALVKLPDKQREVLVLRIWGELEYQHLAEALGISEGTARSHMHHALAGMRRMLGSMRDIDDNQISRPQTHQTAARAGRVQQ